VIQAGRFHEWRQKLTKPLIRVGDVLSFPPDTRLWGVVAIDARGYVIVPISNQNKSCR